MTSVVVAVGRESWEPSLVALLNSGESGLQLVRRCVDAVDLGSVVRGGLAEVAIIGARLPRLDLAGIDSVHDSGVRVVGVASDEATANRLRALGVGRVVVVNEADIADTVSVVAAVIGELQVSELPPAHLAEPTQRVGGRIALVCGPAGAPGRTTVAANVAAISAARSEPTLLVDADTDAPILASLLGVLVDEPGMARAVRNAVDVARDGDPLRSATRRLTEHLEFISGATTLDSPDVARSSAIERVLTAAALTYGRVVVDSASWRIADTSRDATGPVGQPLRTLLGLADDVVVVGSADPLGVVRLLAVLTQVQHAAPQAQHFLVLNRARHSALGGAEREVLDVLREHAELPETFVVPDDRANADACVLNARVLVDMYPKSKASAAFRQLADALTSAQQQVAPSSFKRSGGWLGERLPQLRRAG